MLDLRSLLGLRAVRRSDFEYGGGAMTAKEWKESMQQWLCAHGDLDLDVYDRLAVEAERLGIDVFNTTIEILNEVYPNDESLQQIKERLLGRIVGMGRLPSE